MDKQKSRQIALMIRDRLIEKFPFEKNKTFVNPDPANHKKFEINFLSQKNAFSYYNDVYAVLDGIFTGLEVQGIDNLKANIMWPHTDIKRKEKSFSWLGF